MQSRNSDLNVLVSEFVPMTTFSYVVNIYFKKKGSDDVVEEFCLFQIQSRSGKTSEVLPQRSKAPNMALVSALQRQLNFIFSGVAPQAWATSYK